MIGMMTTENEDINQMNMVMLVDEMHEKLKQQGVNTDKEQIKAFLE